MKRAFTLIELLVVLTVIALLTGLLAPAVLNLISVSKKQADETILSNLKLAIERYAADRSSLGNPRGGNEASRDFPFMYAWYLNGERIADGEASYFELNAKTALVDSSPLYAFVDGKPDYSSEVDTTNGPLFETPSQINVATHISNPWGHAYYMRVRNEPLATGSSRYRSTHLVIRSWGELSGDQGDATDGREDDVFWMLDLSRGKWTRLYADPRAPTSPPTDPAAVDETKYQGWYWTAGDGYSDEESFFLLTEPYADIEDELD